MTASVAAPTQAPPQAGVGVRPRANWTRAEALGLLLIAAGPAFMLVLGVTFGMDLMADGTLGFFLPMIIVPLVAAGLVWRFGTWAKAVGILAAVAAGAMLFWTAFGLSHPSSFGDFVPGVLVPGGVALTIGGGVAAIVAGRRGHFDASRGETRVLQIAGAIVVVAVLASAALWVTARTSIAATEGQVAMAMKDFAFDQESYTVTAGEASELHVHNGDAFLHTVTIPELGVDTVVPAGSDAVVEITAEAGTYTLYCEPHSDLSEPDPVEAGMAAHLIAQ